MLPYSADFEQEFLESGVDIKDVKPEDTQPLVNKIIS